MAVRVAVGIPSLCESDSIAHVVAQADRGLSRLFDPDSCMIVNVDSASPDGTAEVFRRTPTSCRKESLVLEDEPRGKGRNVWRFFDYCVENDVEFLATLDADVASITPGWIDALFAPLCAGQADFVAPLYSRSRFDAVTTNFFAYPLFYGLFGVDVRQPIGGEFALSRAFVSYLRRQASNPATFGYGIDIFMSMHAVGGAFELAQVELGKKIDKPSWPKRERIFPDVAAAALLVARQYGIVRTPDDPVERMPVSALDDSEGYAHRQDAQRLLDTSLRRIRRRELAWLDDARLIDELESPELRAATEAWSEILAAWIRYTLGPCPDLPQSVLAAELETLVVVRAVLFWERNMERPSTELAAELTAQARLVRGNLLKRPAPAFRVPARS